MSTPSRHRYHRNESTDESGRASIQPRPFSDPYDNQHPLQTHDLSHVDLFSHAPQRGAIQAKSTGQLIQAKQETDAPLPVQPRAAEPSHPRVQRDVLDDFAVTPPSNATQADEDTFFGRGQNTAMATAPQNGSLIDVEENQSTPGSGVALEDDVFSGQNQLSPNAVPQPNQDLITFGYSSMKGLEKDYENEITGADVLDTDRYINSNPSKGHQKYVASKGTNTNVRRLTPEELASYELTSKKIADLSPEEQQKYNSKVSKEDASEDSPIFVWRGQPFSTRQMRAMKSEEKGRAIFIMTQDGKIYTADQEAESPGSEGGSTWAFHHSSFLAGQPVAAAGELIFDGKGHLCGVTNSSGHYKPEAKHLQQVLEEFQKRGVDLSNVTATVYSKGGAFTMRASVLLEFKGESDQLKDWLLTNKKLNEDYVQGDQALKDIIGSLDKPTEQPVSAPPKDSPMEPQNYIALDSFSAAIQEAGLTSAVKKIRGGYQATTPVYKPSEAMQISKLFASTRNISTEEALSQLFKPQLPFLGYVN